MSSKDGGVFVRKYYPSAFNLFGVKQDDAKQFDVDVLI